MLPTFCEQVEKKNKKVARDLIRLNFVEKYCQVTHLGRSDKVGVLC
jgi:hypothetical protein